MELSGLGMWLFESVGLLPTVPGATCAPRWECVVAGSHRDQNSTGRLSQGVSRQGPWSAPALPCPALPLHSGRHKWAPGSMRLWVRLSCLAPQPGSPQELKRQVYGDPGGGLSLPPVPPLALQPWLRAQRNDLQSVLHSGRRDSFQMQL